MFPGEDDYNELQRRFSELREKCERADVEEARKDRLIHQLQRELSKYSETSEVEMTNLKTSVKRVTEEKVRWPSFKYDQFVRISMDKQEKKIQLREPAT